MGVLLGSLLLAPAWAAAGSYRFFMEGLGHPLAAPSHLLALVALSVLLAQQVWQPSKIPQLMVLVQGGLTLVLVLASTLWYRPRPPVELFLLGLALVMGVLAILRLSLPAGLLQLFALLVMVTIGLDSAAPRLPGLRGTGIQLYLLGTWCGVMLIWLAALLLSRLLRQLLDGLPLRILGSWITAATLIVMTLQLANLFRA
ncbi:MAG: HupE/UreJ family protein [Thiothrix sp.]|nr:HupE/UreJ family protein [Thiothrix sp.]HPQ94444.1 HupE/UreJ family protein [Thiolinea sp.]